MQDTLHCSLYARTKRTENIKTMQLAVGDSN